LTLTRKRAGARAASAHAGWSPAIAHAAVNDPFPWGECTWWAALKRPDLFPKVHGNAGEWLAEAQSGGMPTGSTPAVGAIAVFLPWVDGAGAYGHVAYVEAVNGDGTLTISEYNFQGYHVGPTYRRVPAAVVSGFIYGGPVSTPAYAPTKPAAQSGYHVYGTGREGLLEHRSPDRSSPTTGTLANGASVNIVCQTQTASVVNGSAIWDKLDNGSYVSDYFVDTPNVGSFTPSIQRCDVPAAAAQAPPAPPGSGQYHVYHAPGGLFLRAGPSTESAVVGSLPEGAAVAIICQVKSGSVVQSSDVWDLLSSNSWVSDYYIDTPVVGGFTPGLPQCQGQSPAPTPPSGGPPPPGGPPPTASAPVYVAPAGSTPQTYHVQRVGPGGLYERSGPGTNYDHIGWLPEGATIMIACQVISENNVEGSPVWDLLTDGGFVTDFYTDTPVVGNFSPGIARCEVATQV
jgi:surface antigen